MSKKNTRISGYQLLKNSFYELFHPKADCPLINYKSLHVIDHNQLKLIHIPTLAAFFQYIGALAVVLFITTAFTFRYFEMKHMIVIQYPPTQSANEEYYSAQPIYDYAYLIPEYEEVPVVLGESDVYEEDQYGYEYESISEEYLAYAYDETMVLEELYPEYPAFEEEYSPEYMESTSGYEEEYPAEVAYYDDYRSGESEVYIPEPQSVLGAFTEVAPAYAQAPATCSFVVNETFVPSGARYSLAGDTAVRVCASFDTEVAASQWNVLAAETYEQSEPYSCVDLQSVSGQSQVEVLAYDANGLQLDQCVLNFVQ